MLLFIEFKNCPNALFLIRMQLRFTSKRTQLKNIPTTNYKHKKSKITTYIKI